MYCRSRCYASLTAGSSVGPPLDDAPELPSLDLHVTHHWRTFKFTPKLDESYAQVGWEATCQNPDHRRCVRTMNFRKYAGQVQVERRLMFWCLACHDIDTKENHFRIPFPHPLPRIDSLQDVQSVRDMLLQSGAEGVIDAPPKRQRMQ